MLTFRVSLASVLPTLLCIASLGCADSDGGDPNDGPPACVGGEYCVAGLVCVDGFCIDPSLADEETGGNESGDGDGDPGDGDGAPGDGDGDSGDGDPGDGDTGDGDGDTGDGDSDPTTDTDDPTTDTDDPTADTGEPCDFCEIGQLCSGGDFCQWVCGWNGGYYTCDAMGTSPTDPIECPAGDYIPGAACPPGLTYEGCCDEYGDSWWCEDAVIKLQECT